MKIFWLKTGNQISLNSSLYLGNRFIVITSAPERLWAWLFPWAKPSAKSENPNTALCSIWPMNMDRFWQNRLLMRSGGGARIAQKNLCLPLVAGCS